MKLESAKRTGKRIGRSPKVNESTLRKYLEKYRHLKLKDIWKIMRGYEISYYQFLRRVRKLREKL